MGVTYTNDPTRTKCYRVAIQRHGENKQGYFLTKSQAQDFYDKWDRKLLKKYGPRSGARLAALDKQREAAAARREQADKERNYLAPCGNITKAGNHAARTKNPRCSPGPACKHYADCLGAASKRNWPGWKVKRTS